jgi:hypothetical protein
MTNCPNHGEKRHSYRDEYPFISYLAMEKAGRSWILASILHAVVVVVVAV